MNEDQQKSTDRNITDQELVDKLILEKDDDLFGILFARYRNKVFEKCMSMVREKSTAEDLTQDVLTKAWEKINSFKKQSKFSTWLYSITYNTCIDHLRRNKRLKFDHWVDHIEIPDQVDESDMDRIMDLRSEQLALLLEMLKPDDKAIILMKYQYGYDVRYISEILGLKSESAAKMRLSRAKQRLQAIYSKFLPAL